MEKQAASLLAKWTDYESTIIQGEVEILRIQAFLMFIFLLAMWVVIEFLYKKFNAKRNSKEYREKDNKWQKKMFFLFKRSLVVFLIVFGTYHYCKHDSNRVLKEEFYNAHVSEILQYVPIEKTELKSLSSSERLYYIARFTAANGGERKIIRYAVETDKGIQFEEIPEDGNTIYYQPIDEGDNPELVVYQKKFISEKLETIFYENTRTTFLGFSGQRVESDFEETYYSFRCPKESLDMIGQKFEVN